MAGSSKLMISSIPGIDDLIASIKAGINERKPHQSTNGGAGGSYFMHDASGNKVAVFKPRDEEAVNPQQQQSEEEEDLFVEGTSEGTPEGLKPGTKAGKGCLREIAAYILDHPISGRRPDSHETFGFAGVPPTYFVKSLSVHFKNPEGAVNFKSGSLQKYMENHGDCRKKKIGPDKYIFPDEYKKFPTDEVHKIAVLDMRFANADRHGGNLLRIEYKGLIPIDHGYCFPSKFRGDKFVWLTWPQAKQPFSPETIKYIETLDAEKDIRLLESYGLDVTLPVARVFRVSTMLLKEGAKKKLTPHAIGKSMRRNKNNREGTIEKIFNEALKKFPLKENYSDFINAVSANIDSPLDEIAKRLQSDISLKIGTPS